MKSISNRLLVGLLIVAIAISLVGTIVSLTKVGKIYLPGQLLTGAASQSGTGVANLTVQGTVGLSVVYGVTEFGAGYVNASCTSANLTATHGGVYTNGSNTCWLNITGQLNNISQSGWGQLGTSRGYHTVTNNGTTLVNVTLEVGVPTAESFLCGAANGCNSSISAVGVRAVTNETGACTGTLNPNWQSLLTAAAATNLTLCTILDFADSSDAIDIEYNVTIPTDTPQGVKSLTVTYTGGTY
jgi:hypothetical protein